MGALARIVLRNGDGPGAPASPESTHSVENSDSGMGYARYSRLQVGLEAFYAPVEWTCRATPWTNPGGPDTLGSGLSGDRRR